MVALDVDQLAGDARILQAVQHRLVQVLRQLNQCEVSADGDATEVLGVQPALVGQGTNNGTRAHVLALAHVQTVGVEVPAVVEAAPATAIAPVVAVETVTAASTTVAAVIPVETVAAIALVARRLLHQELVASQRLGGQGGGDVVHRHVVGRGVLADHGLEHLDVRGLEGFGDGIHELGLARLVDLVDGGQVHLLDRRVGHALDGAQHATLARGDKQDRLAGTACAAGAADAVHVRLGVVRDVVVEHVRDALDIQAAGCNIGCHEDVQAAVAQLVHGALALLLGDVAVDGCCGESARAQLLGDFFRLVLRAHEHNHRLKLRHLEDAGDGVELVTVRREQVTLRDVGVGAGLRLNGDLFRVVQVVAGDAANRVRHRRGEQRHLLRLGRVLEDALHVLLEAHVEHLVRLVEHEELQVGDVQRALLQVVDHTTRRTHDDLGAPAQAGKLDAVGLAAVDGQDVHAAQVVGEGLEGVRHLQRQLARRRQHERLRVALFRVDLGEHRQRERRGLAGTRLRQADHVAALHQQRDGLRLNRRGLLEPHAFDGLHHGIGQVQLLKAVLRLFLLSRLFLLGGFLGGGFGRRFVANLQHIVVLFNGHGIRGAGLVRNSRIPGVLCDGLNDLGRDILRVFLIFRHIHIRLILAAGGVFGIAHRLPTLRHNPRVLLFLSSCPGPRLLLTATP